MSGGLNSVLVTGAAGQLGREVVALLAAGGVRTVALDLVQATDLPVDDLIVGSATDVDVVRRVVKGVDGIVHLAALRSPDLGAAEDVFVGNTSATFTVLEQGAQAGVRRAVIASSYSITGLPFAISTRCPAYLPIDDDIPLQIEDPYALSKRVDELIGQMMWWRHHLSVVALRFPFLGGLEDTLAERANWIREDPSNAARELWTYLDTRDAAHACVAGLTEPDLGFQAITIGAPYTLAPYSTEELLDIFYPTVPRRRVFEGRAAPLDLRRAQSQLNWDAREILRLEERSIDAGVRRKWQPASRLPL